MALGFFTGDNSPDSYEARERNRRIAEALMAQGSDYSPVRSWTQGAARLAQGLIGGYEAGQYDKQDRENAKAYGELTKALIGGSAFSPIAPSQSMTTADAGGASKPASGSQADFIASLKPHADKIAAETGLDPRLIIAQAALESRWGQSAPGNNYFGIKSHGQPGGQTLATTEVVNGQPVQTQDSFRSYAGMEDSAKGYADFLKSNPRYQPMLQAQGLDAQIAALAKSGYATDPDYGAKIGQIARGIQLPQSAPVQTASLDGLPPGPVPSNAPPMAYAPGQQAISAAMPQTGPTPPPRPLGAQVAQNLSPTSPPIPQPQPTGNVNAALYAIMSDPRFSPQQKNQAMMLFQMQQKNPMVIPEGATIYDPRNGTMTQPTPKMSDQERQYNAARAGGFQGSFFDYQQQLAKARGTQVNIDQKTETAADTEAAKALVKRNVSALDAADKSQAAMADINTMREISRRVGSVGSNADLKSAIGPYAEAFGVNIEGLSDIQAFEAVIQRMAPQMRAEGSGSTSDVEFKGMLASLPRLRSNPQAREMILDTMEANARYNIMRGDIALKVLTKEITREAGEKQMRALGDPMAAFKEFRKANPNLFTGPAPKDEPRTMTPQERAIEELRRRSGT